MVQITLELSYLRVNQKKIDNQTQNNKISKKVEMHLQKSLVDFLNINWKFKRKIWKK